MDTQRDTEETKRRVAGEELMSVSPESETLETLIQQLSSSESRLLTADADYVEITHEALIREWDLLKGWIEEERENLRINRRLTQDVEEWLRAGQNPDFLYTGSRLAQMEDWAHQNTILLNENEKQFIEESITKRGNKKKRERRIRLGAFGLLSLFIIALSAAFFSANVAEVKAQKQAQLAKQEKDRAQAVLDKIYFYEGRFGLAYEYGSYGFIDKALNPKIDFKYDEALPFDDTGFARVKRADQNFLIDTTGRQYPVANDVSRLAPGITALDLRNRDLNSLSSKILGHQGLEVLLLSQNQLTELPTEIGQLINLSSLELRYSKLTELPPEIRGMKSLRALRLGGNPIPDDEIEGLRRAMPWCHIGF